MNLAADANVLLSAVIGGRASLALRNPQVGEIFSTEHTLAEVREYTTVLARKKRLAADILLLAVAALPVTVVSRARYAKRLPEAMKLIGCRDPDDVELLALALHFDIPVWTNDRDFEGLPIDLFTTESLLRRLGVIH